MHMYTYVHMYMYIYVYIYNGVITSGNEIGKSISRIPNLASEIGALCHIFRDIDGFRKVDCHKRERRVTDSASKTPAACAHQRPRRPINGVVHPADACLVCDLWQLIPKATDVTVCNAFVGCNGRNNNSLQQLLQNPSHVECRPRTPNLRRGSGAASQRSLRRARQAASAQQTRPSRPTRPQRLSFSAT